jgi:hypothetical protein
MRAISYNHEQAEVKALLKESKVLRSCERQEINQPSVRLKSRQRPQQTASPSVKKLTPW